MITEALMMNASTFDRNAWLERIGYAGPADPTLDTLNRLIFCHSHAISYESLDIMPGRTPKLDIVALQEKMVRAGRGGYCFEQNLLFREGLRSMGYAVTSLQGRVVRGLAIDAPRPAIHVLLQVDLPNGPFLADVGFGNLAPTSALLMSPGIEQDTPHETMRFIDIGGELTLQARFRGGWEHIYRVVPYPRYDSEYEITNWYTATHPSAPYKSNMIAAKPGPNRTRLTLFNARLTVRSAEHKPVRRILIEDREFVSVLRDEFGLALSDADVSACITVMKERGETGAPHPFFA